MKGFQQFQRHGSTTAMLVGSSIITVDDAASDGQSAENKVLAWGFDADSDPYGGVVKTCRAAQLDWLHWS